MRIALFTALFFACATSWGQAYRCKDTRGATVYQGWPCDANQNSNKVNTQSTSGAQFAKTTQPPSSTRPENLEGSDKAGTATNQNQSSPRVNRQYGQTIQHSENPQQPGGPKAGSLAAERKFISVGMDRSEVYARIGPPNSKIEHFARTDHLRDPMLINQINKEPIGSTETYHPVPGDEETQTIIRYRGNSVERVVRTVVR